MKPKRIPVDHELLCEAIGHLEEYADSHRNGGDKLNLQIEREVRRIIKNLDKQRELALSPKVNARDAGTAEWRGQ